MQTFGQGYAGGGVSIRFRPVSIRVGPGVGVLAGNGPNLVGLAGDLTVIVHVTHSFGIALNANVATFDDPMTGSFAIARAGAGFSLVR